LTSGQPTIVEPSVHLAPATPFRGDIDGLRAMAILLIVAYHIGVPGFSGGFIGVDVFFVISGWLITRNLVLEGESRGRIDLWRFWAKRIRRLVPALSSTIVATAIASSILLPRVELSRTKEEGVAAALYVSNVFFRYASEGYFGADVSRSPYLHTWSLGVEEQFYVVWPLVSAAVFSFASRGRSPRRYLAIAFVAILICSFAWNLVLTSGGGPRAFYSLSARAWEFAIAAILATVPRSVWLAEKRPALAALIGISLLVLSAASFTHATPFPGAAAVLPVVGTLLLIAAGERRAGGDSTPLVSAVLTSRPLQWLGRVSYSLYLWHWPFVVLAVGALGRDQLGIRAIAALGAVPVAYLAYRFIENPIRFADTLTRSTARTVAVGATATGVAILVTLAAAHTVESRMLSDIDAQVRTAGADIYPKCVTRKSSSGIEYCAGGNLESGRVVMLVGDSHADIWFNAVSDVARESGLTAALHAESGCPFIRVVARMQPENTLTMEECRERRSRGETLIRDLNPVGVILTQWNGYVGLIEDDEGKIPSSTAQKEIWKSAYATFLSSLRGKGIRSAVILDNPTLSASPLPCISRKQSFSACAEPRDETLARTKLLQDAELDVLSGLSDVPTLAPNKFLCDAVTCNVVLNGRIAYADEHHLTNHATKQMEAELRRLLRALVIR
jgi:peptidoglycan/LPS O-acetylase OafA/YrhL